ncbi:type-F conjugative transfer system mating-pair stabilization protein TraN [Pantoea agglomerans]|uniref:type-F conjugative transfer system mating-pair stabilization protein TraN n=1 Tax=Enterobacter agglomerans TaxID=549 RepID=UPI0024130676|nr:type-F conjugative transfer system mating-pair stabilization protein TraN [Pantoea agglomerans]
MKQALIMVVSLLLCASALADTRYDDASEYADSVKGKGMDTLKGTDPSAVIPGYTASPDQSEYYGGTTATSNTALDSNGTTEMNSSEAGKTIQEVIKNRPSDPISTDAPFISGSLDVEDQAETITQGTDTQCKDVDVNKTQITNYTCERTPAIELACTRTASVTGHYETTQENKNFPLTLTSASREGNRARVDFLLPASGSLTGAAVAIQYPAIPSYQGAALTITASFGGSVVIKAAQAPASLPVTDSSVTAGQGAVLYIAIQTSGHRDDAINTMVSNLRSGKEVLTLNLQMLVDTPAWVPDIAWTENCPFDKSDQVLIGTACTDPGGDRTVTVDGKPFTVHSDCWQYTDTYVSQSADNGTCGQYMNNTACTVAGTTCLDVLNGHCLREQAVFSCEEKVSGSAQLCGGTLVCADGSCDHLENNSVNDFQSAVSGLAALAAAGKDIAALNGVNVSAFTGEGKSCRKAMAGFSNCCKDSGWGQDAGLASCNTEEKALGEAKNRKLTIYVGSYCAHKVLGVCLEKKEGYCQFDSKLAKIIQDQGRRGQLGIGFGSGESPDCRGLTVDELQHLNFSAINFADFYDDLENGTTLPADQTLIDRVKQQVADKMKGGTQ